VVDKKKVWLATDHGAYRIDEDVQIDVALKSVDSWWKTVAEHVLRLLGRTEPIWLSGVVQPAITYRSKGNKPTSYSQKASQQCKIILASNEEEFQRAKEEKEYATVSRVSMSLQTNGVSRLQTNKR
jgi:hypothetical protein